LVCSPIVIFKSNTNEIGSRGKRISSKVKLHQSKRGTTILPLVSRPRGTKRWVSKIRARKPLEGPREVKEVARRDLGSREVRVRVGRSRPRLDVERCIGGMCTMYLITLAGGANIGSLILIIGRRIVQLTTGDRTKLIDSEN
jgi:hypothetical protein